MLGGGRVICTPGWPHTNVVQACIEILHPPSAGQHDIIPCLGRVFAFSVFVCFNFSIKKGLTKFVRIYLSESSALVSSVFLNVIW